MKYVRGLATLLGLHFSVVLAGCATTKSVSDVGFPLSGSQVYITAVQKEIETETSATNPMAAGGGLLGVLIVNAVDSSANRKAEEAVAALRDELIDFAIATEFTTRILESDLTARISNTEAKVFFEEPGEEFEHAGDFIEVHPLVQLSNDLSALEVSIWIQQFDLTDRGKPRFAGFSQGYTYVHALPEPTEDNNRAAYAEAWLRLGSETIQSLTREGMDATIEAAKIHLKDGEPDLPSSADYYIPEYTGRAKYRLWQHKEDLVWLVNRQVVNEVIIISGESVEKVPE